jgi:methylisocitrate lyase
MRTTAGHAFRQLLRRRRADGAVAQEGSLILPGCFDGIVARMAVRKGFQALYLSGGGTSALSGVPDVGIVGRDQFEDKLKNLAFTSGVPVLSDADTGFSDPVATVHAYIAAGAAGLHIEDQIFPKRCGHLGGKELVPALDFAAAIQRCVEAVRDSRDNGFIICARTDARGVEENGIDATIERLQLYANAGATMLFPEGLRSEDEFAHVAKSLRVGVGSDDPPFLLANMTEFGVSPQISAARLGELGYDVAIFPMGLFRVAMRAVDAALDTLGTTGSMELLANEDNMLTRMQLYDLLKYDPMEMPWEYPNPSSKHK